MLKMSKPAMPSGEVLSHRQKAEALNARADLLRARASLHHAKADLHEKREGKPSSRYMDFPVPELATTAPKTKSKPAAKSKTSKAKGKPAFKTKIKPY